MESDLESTMAHSTGEGSGPQSELNRKHTALTFIEAAPMFFRPGFREWLDKNYSVWLAFEREAILAWNMGRRNYGANTIIEFLRHHTLITEKDSDFKICDMWTSSIARLFAMMHADKETLFAFRERKNGVVRAPKTGNRALV